MVADGENPPNTQGYDDDADHNVHALYFSPFLPHLQVTPKSMGQQPAKYFPWPTPYGQSPDSNVLNQAIAPPQAPLNNFLPLNPADPSQTGQSSSAGTSGPPRSVSANPFPRGNIRQRFSFLGDNF